MKFIRMIAGAGLLAALAAGPSAAQTRPQTRYWTCSYTVPTSKGVGLGMSLLGPTGEHQFVQTTYLASFQTEDNTAMAMVKIAEYKKAFGEYLAGAGYNTVSQTGEKASSNCTFSATAAEDASLRAELASNMQGGGIHVTVNPVAVNWKPANDAAPPPVQTSAQATAPATLKLLGATFEDVSTQTAAFLGLDPPKGAAVMAVEAGGKAEAAGLKRMDVVIEIAGQAIGKAGDITAILSRMRPGFQAPLRVWRDRKAADLSLEVPPGLTQAATASAPARPRLGVKIMDNEKREHEAGGSPQAGAYVAEVLPGGPAEAAGFHAGDIIVEVADIAVSNAAETTAAIAKAPAGPAVIKFWRNGELYNVTIPFAP